MSNKLGLRGAAIAAVLLAVPAMAAAQNYPPPGGGPPGPGMAPSGPQRDANGFWPRRGIYGGFGIGFGQLTYGDCQDCSDDSWGGFGFHGNLGWHLNPQLGIFVDADFVAVNPTDGDFDVLLMQYVGTAGVQFWVTPPLWLKGGIGSAQQAVGGDDTNCDDPSVDCTSDTAPAILFAGGYEVLHGPNFSIDAELRLGAGFYEEFYGGTVTNVSLQFSVNWHSLFSGAVVVVN
jgi:hypothetical protein